ncbi:histidine--tRNA ligase [Bartonella sp. DGB2]|uniref:histidine--tRNA ligase n=1 Tax=Bartonella sp. DGB2 TaxID=3388426 RepID=UPI0039902F2A
MTEKNIKNNARLPRGFVDYTAQDLYVIQAIQTRLAGIYERYGFEAIETPIFEYSSALGKFLPDQDRPNAGVFSFQDDDEQWLSLRYDLTAPLARHFAEHYETLPKPYRTYRYGYVFRHEKPGPGRFRQFLQFDADSLGSPDIGSDAEMCMMACDSLEAVGLTADQYIIRLNNRKILDGIMEDIGLDRTKYNDKRLIVLRAIDKLDRLGEAGVKLLLGKGRLDESGDFTKGADLKEDAIAHILAFLNAGGKDAATTLAALQKVVGTNATGKRGVEELAQMQAIFSATRYDTRIKIDPSVVRGLEYYTGPVFEAELLFNVFNEDGQKVVFGSVGGGGRYDGLIARFRSDPVPATGFSIGVSRLVGALKSLKKLPSHPLAGPVVVLVMDKNPQALIEYHKIIADLHVAGIRAELYSGSAGIKAQMKYADRRNAPCVIIQGQRERAAGTVEIKDLLEGARLSQQIADNQTWRESRPAQITVPRDNIITALKEILGRYS